MPTYKETLFFSTIKHLIGSREVPTVSEVILIDTLDRQLHARTGRVFDDYSYHNVHKHVKRLLPFLGVGTSSEKGYTDIERFFESGTLSLIQDILTKKESCFLRNCKIPSVIEFEFSHMYNLIFLTLIKDVILCQQTNPDLTEEEIAELKIIKTELSSKLTGGIRKNLSLSRIGFIHRIYCGLDTEFKTIDHGIVDLLCFTLSVFSKGILFIRQRKIDFSVSNVSNDVLIHPRDKVPYVGSRIKAFIAILRNLEGKGDNILDDLKKLLQKNDQIVSLEGGDVTYFIESKKWNFTPDSFVQSYHVPDKTSEFSLENLVLLIEQQVGVFDGDYKFLNFIKTLISDLADGVSIPLRIKKDMFLSCHYSPAEISQFKDLKLFQDKLSIIQKCLVTLKPLKMPYSKYKINFRDSQLLTPAGSKGLKGVGALYNDSRLEKLEIDTTRMEEIQQKDLKLFKDYAMRDALITNYHVLNIEKTSLDMTGQLEIPVTLSTLAAKHLYKVIGGPLYDLPTNDGRYNIRDIRRVFTPVGIESMGIASDWLASFLAAYKGGRNESYIYGFLDKGVFDIDIQSAYSTAMAMLDYPVFKAVQIVEPTTGEELISEYGLKLIKGFSTFQIKFKFPEGTLFPNIAVRQNEGTICFPLSGECYSTGMEIYFAVSRLNCDIFIEKGYYIPFKEIYDAETSAARELNPDSVVKTDSSMFKRPEAISSLIESERDFSRVLAVENNTRLKLQSTNLLKEVEKTVNYNK